MVFLISLIARRVVGFTPKQFAPIPWDDLFFENIKFIIIGSFVLSALAVYILWNNDKEKGKK